MSRTPFDDLVHRVNNLLGTIEIQAELAHGTGSVEAYREAMTTIVASARATQDEVRRLRQRSQQAGGD